MSSFSAGAIIQSLVADWIISNSDRDTESKSPFMRRICLRDKQNKITYYPEGSHKVLQEPGMTYVSFLHEGDGELTILGAKYELTSMNYFQKKIYSSNEFVDGPIQVIVPNGYVIVIQTKDRS